MPQRPRRTPNRRTQLPKHHRRHHQLRTLLTSYPEAKVALESTGNLWTHIYDELDKQPTLKVVLTNPYKTHIIAEARIKNDRMDARDLADLVRADLVAESYVPDQEIQQQEPYSDNEEAS